ncbi:MAG TPA: GNAT family N-acetyltransferase [Pyrinomonadaceae bacterium]|nr:GNAT family N-acetyltransferase [Pyrinomonadaceae bacterium]
MVIRQYQPADLEPVIAIFRSNIPKYFGPEEEAGLRKFLRDFSDLYYILEKAGEAVGAGGIALNSNAETVSLCWGMVRSDHLGTGLGKELTEFRIRQSRDRFGNLPLVISTSQHTRGFYEKFGFELTEHTPDGFGPGIDICKMRLGA